MLWCQQTSGLFGTIVDTTGAAVNGASVTATNEGTGLSRKTVTGAAGEYSLAELPVGIYKVEVSKAGFSSDISQPIKLDVQRSAQFNATLHAGSVIETVSVQASQPLLQTGETQLGTLVDNKQIQQLPLNGRYYAQLLFLVPGTSVGNSNADYIFSTHGQAVSSTSVNGMRSIYNAYLIDGVPTQEVADGAPAFQPSLDAIQEFRVGTSNVSAQFGSAAGGQVNLVTKSGTNSFHGSAYDFVRNSLFDARNYFATSTPPLSRNDFGGALGGPILKKHTFFYGSYEGLRLTDGETQQGLVPTAQQRQGDFSYLLAQGIQLHDPSTDSPYPNNMVPVNPIMAADLKAYVPLPTTPSGQVTNYLSTAAGTIQQDGVSGRIDHYLSSEDSLFARWLYQKVDNNSAKLFPTDSYTIASAGQNAAFGETHTFGSSTINEFRFGYNRFWQNENNGRAGKQDVLQQLGINGFCTDPQCWGQPDFDVTGFLSFGEHGAGQTVSGPRHWTDEIFDFSDTITAARGKHSIKAGITYDIYHDSFEEAIFPRGIFSFDGSFTSPDGNANPSTALADFLIGDPRSISASISIFTPYWNYHGFAPWVEDDWRITPTLTANLGLRYEWLGVPTSRYGNFASIDFSADPAQAVTPVIAAGLHYPKALVKNDNTNFAPRVGLSWNPGSFRRSVLRAAYGIFYERELINSWTDLAINAPFVDQSFLTLTPSLLPQYSMSDPLALAANTPGFGSNYAIDPDFRLGQVQQWNASWQFQIAQNTQTTFSYVGNKGTRLPRLLDPNQALPGPGSVVSKRPYIQFGEINYIDSHGGSNYNALQIQLEQRESHGLSLIGAYTYSKCLDDSPGSFSGEGGTHYVDVRHFDQYMYSECGQDTRHRFTLSYVYDLPFGPGKVIGSSLSYIPGELVRDWQISGITTWSAGQPFTVIMSGDWANVGDGDTTPNLSGSSKLPSSQRHLDHYFNTAAYSAPPADEFGNAKRDSAVGPGVVNFDFALFRVFPVYKEAQLQFRAEAFNVFNHPAFGDPGAVYATPSFGVITSAGSPREMELSLKLVY